MSKTFETIEEMADNSVAVDWLSVVFTLFLVELSEPIKNFSPLSLWFSSVVAPHVMFPLGRLLETVSLKKFQVISRLSRLCAAEYLCLTLLKEDPVIVSSPSLGSGSCKFC